MPRRSALFVAVACCVFACGLFVLAQDASLPKLAEVEVASAQPSELASDKMWTKVPKFLTGATIYSGKPTGRELQAVAKSDGLVVVAASWNYDGNPSGGWYETRTTKEQMLARGWSLIGKAPDGEIQWRENDVHQLYFRSVKAGEKIQFHTRKYNQPFVIVPAAAEFAAAAELFRAPAVAAVAKAEPPAQPQPLPQQPAAPAQPSELSVAGAKPQIANETEWSPLPAYLRGATLLRPAQGNTLDLTAKQDVQVVLAASWAYDGNIGGGWYEGRTRLSRLIEQGWEPIGETTLKDKGLHTLLRRTLKSGEQVKFHTRKYNSPIVLLPAVDQRPAVAKLAAIVMPASDLAAIRPPASGPVAGDKPAVLLRAHEPDLEDRFVERGILLRELVRQAVLLAAREELGQATRDESLREPQSHEGEDGPPPLDIVVTPRQEGRVGITLFRFREGKTELLFNRELQLAGDDRILALTAEAERLARNELVAALRTAGYDGRANAVSDRLPAIEQAESQLAELHPLPQFAAARALHAQFREDGESPERLAALAQAYAHLGILTEHLWYPGHKVFKARALLYAERGVARWPQSAVALQSRGYVRALVGLHQAALDDLAAAQKAEAAALAPAWLPAITSFCRFDLQQLEKLPSGDGQLGRLLRLLAIERYGGTKMILDTADQFLAVVPDSDRAIDCIYETRRLGNYSEAVQTAREQMGRKLYERLDKLSDLPGSARLIGMNVQQAPQLGGPDGLDERRQRLALIRALREAGRIPFDRSEPSWQAVAAWIDEALFGQAQRQVQAASRGFSGQFDEKRLELTEGTQDHPLWVFLDSICDDRALRRQKLAEVVRVVRRQDLTLNELFLVQFVENNTRPDDRLSSLMMKHQDNVYRDVLQQIRNTRELYWPQYSGTLRRVSPHSPVTIATSAQFDWTYAAPHAAEWEERYALSPQVQTALGRQYLKQEKYADAARCLARATKLQPEYANYKLLADAWLKQQNEKQWQATWDAFLQEEEFGLEHARARVNVAEYFMLQRRWAEALPYAQEAAGVGADWTTECIADCLTGLKRYGEAEDYVRSMSQTYLEIAPVWYFWCARTGRGDRAGARIFARETMANRAITLNMGYRLAFLVIDGDKAEALRQYRESLDRQPSPQFAWMAAILAEELKQPEVRDKALPLVIETGRRPEYNRPYLVEAAQLAQPALTDPAQLAALPKRADALLARIEDPRERAVVAYMLGKLLDLRGRPEGIALLKQAARLPFTTPQSALAASELLDRKIIIDDAP